MRNWFAELNSIDVGEHIEQKNGLNYLSWMWAWTELQKHFPGSYATVHESPEGLLVWRDPVGCHVKTSITLTYNEEDGTPVEYTATEYLPCMDFKNKAIPYDSVDSTAVNKTIQRSLTKCIARLGLGAYIYAGEDLPEEQAQEKKQQEKKEAEASDAIAKLRELVRKNTVGMDKDAKNAWAEKTIVPVLGMINYTKCTDIDKLNTLINILSNVKENTNE